MDQPLLSLEESLQEIAHLIPRLQYHIYIAMIKSENPADGLTLNKICDKKIKKNYVVS